MSFPETRFTLIQRLASLEREEDWQVFVRDYWGPVCRFAVRWGARNRDDAEDVASQTFEVLWSNRLLVRWTSTRSAKLRTLLCAVVRNILSNANRVRRRREELAQDLIRHVEELHPAEGQSADAFYDAWVDEILERAVQSLAAEYCAQGKANYLRVLYGRLCQRVAIAELAQVLRLKPADVDNYYRHARERLGKNLQQIVRQHIERYTPAENVPEEFDLEWQQLGRYLLAHNGLEAVVGRACGQLDFAASSPQANSLSKAVDRLTSIIRASARPPANRRAGGK
jgi:DNA-directed RNA polymerase specialized sigma24 family protein